MLSLIEVFTLVVIIDQLYNNFDTIKTCNIFLYLEELKSINSRFCNVKENKYIPFSTF